MFHAGFFSPLLTQIALLEAALAVFAAVVGRAGFGPGMARVALVCLLALPAAAGLDGLLGWVSGTEDPVDVALDGRWIGVLGAGVMALVTAPFWAGAGAATLWLRARLRARLVTRRGLSR